MAKVVMIFTDAATSNQEKRIYRNYSIGNEIFYLARYCIEYCVTLPMLALHEKYICCFYSIVFCLALFSKMVLFLKKN